MFAIAAFHRGTVTVCSNSMRHTRHVTGDTTPGKCPPHGILCCRVSVNQSKSFTFTCLGILKLNRKLYSRMSTPRPASRGRGCVTET